MFIGNSINNRQSEIGNSSAGSKGFVIDLHLHTTASDGELTPAALVGRAASAGITVLSVTDHDTVAGVNNARDAAGRHGLTLVTVDATIQGYPVAVLQAT